MATQSATKERPILFSGPMVRAILDGRKTVTRRVLTNAKRGDDCPEEMWQGAMGDIVEWRQQEGRWFGLMGYRTLAYADCPYGKPGDRLWVRETFRETFDIDDQPVMEYRAGGTRLINGKSICHGKHRITSVLPKWKPSIFMPRWASRATLTVVSVMVERLQDITEEDARLEGFEQENFPSKWPNREYEIQARGGFRSLWDKLNESRGFSWESNPWVWRVGFKRIDT